MSTSTIRTVVYPAFLLAACFSAGRASAAGLAPALVSPAGELLLTLGRTASWPVLALVDGSERLRGALHRTRDGDEAGAPRLVVVDDSGHWRVVVGRYNSIDGRVRCGLCVVFLDFDERPRAVLTGARLALYDGEGAETQAVEAPGRDWVALEDARGVLRARSRPGAAYLLDDKGIVQALVLESPAGPTVGVGPVRLGAGEKELAGLPPEQERPAVHLAFSDRRARNREVPALRWAVPPVDFPESGLRGKPRKTNGGMTLRLVAASGN